MFLGNNFGSIQPATAMYNVLIIIYIPEIFLCSEIGMEQKVSGKFNTDHPIVPLLWVGVV